MQVYCTDDDAEARRYSMGMLVRHDEYGVEKLPRCALGRPQARSRAFRAAGERTFVADKAKLAILPSS